ncbi:acetyl esterase/lipase [Sphingomonas sp. BE138]|uniref:alpha/beta hydrolase family protein n=1 Tax=Sphingomonas sp. BE138 TaxID=2817845 RepID=UPI00285D348B|nr:alpha/beta hydrolase [Sphingomonas sp. BE138]MDR6790002.1 acetyl esterase/lipase [Sphingomonas sp. BE138]
MKSVAGVLLCVAIASVSTSVPVRAQEADPERVYKAAGAKASRPMATVAYGSSELQVADLRLPTGKGPFPVAVVIHGGCFMSSVDKRSGIAAFADALTERGYATWNIEYRRVGDPSGGWPGTFEDVAAAIDKLADVAPRYKLDMKRVAFVGHSAGAYFALWAASRPRLMKPWSNARVRPIAVAAIDGPGTLASFVGLDAQVCGRPVIVPLMGGTPSQKPAEYRLASPQDHLPLGMPQLLVLSDLADLMRPYVAAAKAGGDTVQTLTPPNANHFDVVTPKTPNGQAVVRFVADNLMPRRP